MSSNIESPISEIHLPCPCGNSSDAFTRRDDGSGFCFSCGKNFFADQMEAGVTDPTQSTGKRAMSETLQELLDSSDTRAIKSRLLTQATARAMDLRVRVAPQSGKQEHIYVYHDEQGVPVWAKVRDVEAKEFSQYPADGSHKKVRLWGLNHLGKGGKQVIITEGELDAASISQLWDNKWPVVSGAGGATSLAKDVAHHMEALLQFDKIIIASDMDEPGRKAAVETARLFPPGKAYIADLPAKDASQALMEGKNEELIHALWHPREYRPDGIVAAADLVGLALSPPVSGLSWPWQWLTGCTYGRRYGELYTLGAGTGVGKSDFFNQVVAHTISINMEPCAVFSYESSPVGTLKAIAGKLAGKRFHIPDPQHLSWTDDQLRETLAQVTDKCAPLYINDHFGAVDWASVKERIRYLRHAHDVRHFFIDPLTALVAQAEDERRALDGMVAEMAQLCVELQICLYISSHLSRPQEGHPHEEGGRVMLKHFRGSNAIGMWSFYVFGMERNQQSEDEEERSKTTVRILKDRYTGNSLGQTHPFFFNPLTGILEVAAVSEDLDPPPPPLSAEDYDVTLP